jgi:uncharacterized protein
MDLLTKLAVRCAVLGLALYIGAAAVMYVYQRNLQYHPNSVVYDPAKLGLDAVESLKLDTPDGEKIMAWYRKASAGRPTILYFHGNGGGLSNRSEKIRYFTGRDFGFLGVSYRGYEGSTGSPSETGLIIDATAAYDWLVAQGIAPKDILVIGESLGTGVAVQLAAVKPVGAVALESPYANAVDIGAEAYWYLPVRWLMKDQFRSSDHIAKVAAPLLVIHGKQDTLIPFAQGQELFDIANEPKQMNAVEGAGHDLSYDQATWDAEITFFEKALSGTLAAK